MEGKKELSGEMQDFIIEQIRIIHDEKYEEAYQLFQDMKEMSHDIFSGQKEIFKRMDALEQMIHEHAIGVQNVYDSIKDLREHYNEIYSTIHL